MKFELIITSVFVLSVLTVQVSQATGETGMEKFLVGMHAPARIISHRPKLYFDDLNKQDFQSDPPVTTVRVVNTTMQILGALATFTAFIIKPIIYAIFASAGRPIYKKSLLVSPFSNESQYESARGILDRDRCIERISCDVAYYTNGRSYMRRFAESVFPVVTSFPDGITGRIMKTLAKQSDVCSQYTCDPVGFLIRLFIYKIDWNTLLKS